MASGDTVVIGAGPAGLAAAHELTRQGVRPLVLDKSDKVGGDLPNRTLQGIPLRHRRAPVLHAFRRGPGAVA